MPKTFQSQKKAATNTTVDEVGTSRVTVSSETNDNEMSRILNQQISNWSDMGLEKRILSAIYKLGFENPTRIQQRCIPVAMAGRDILGKAVTGSGKTAAYVIPAIQAILSERSSTSRYEEGVRAIILVPTKELCVQVQQQVRELAQHCASECLCYAITGDAKDRDLRGIKLQENPAIIVGTARHIIEAFDHESSYSERVKQTLSMLVVDEGDLVVSGQLDHVKKLIDKYLPSSFQCIMMSATIDSDKRLHELLLKNPVQIAIEGETEEEGRVMQYHLDAWQHGPGTSDNKTIDKLLYMYYLIAYKFKGGRVIIFVNRGEMVRGNLIQLVLKSMGIADSVLLSEEFPLVSRIDIIDQFNKGKYTALITSDSCLEGNASKREKKQNARSDRLEKETSSVLVDMSRGIDFKKVAAVINFDVPQTVESYTHRIGRTARAGQLGVAITILCGNADPDKKENI
jgi:ATP-dependent RNA helicase DDX56/DBP9